MIVLCALAPAHQRLCLAFGILMVLPNLQQARMLLSLKFPWPLLLHKAYAVLYCLSERAGAVPRAAASPLVSQHGPGDVQPAM